MVNVPVDLWRGVHEDDFKSVVVDDGPVEDILLPTMSPKKLKNGKTRKPDVQVKDGMVQPGGGTSLFDKDKFFRGKSWNFFKLPVGTEVPPDLVLTGPAWNDNFAANHYQIEIQKPLTVEAYRQKLDHFARLAYAKAYIDAH